MNVIDLTQTISEDMSVFPGTEKPKLTPANSYEADGFKETLFTMFSHTGTHMDPPVHLFAGKTTLDRFPAGQFVGKAVVVDCRGVKAGGRIGMACLDRDRARVDAADFILFNTGWSRFWGTDEYLGDFPLISEEVARYLIGAKKKGLGVDVISIDPIADDDLTIHKLIFSSAETVIIENLTNLEHCGKELFTFICLPLKWKNADGAPARAIALLE
ncbi:MAG: cyclase family protein [Clostridiales Family XIII bacterium]|jgi:kynurenine formamidase|nr:cyclase family protein [Clostridiales Family XIII bacterium]